MYFKKLEMIGFKSFLQKTTLRFEPGITAVVGPNGCGKSNIFDAIRWVLGEQSVKALRGSDMRDIIFNGSESKEPLGMAEVTLVFDNSGEYFPLKQDEVAISRRIFRSGEGEYLLNKTTVRLKDILDLLLGTGIGAESYSLVQQGKIDLILSSRPEDRRLVFDEAAGITKYKAQKKEALRKLEETQQNLLRVNDIIAEVKRQINSLERQAAKARKYKEAFEELKSKETVLATLQKNILHEESGQILRQLDDLKSQGFRLLNGIRGAQEQMLNFQTESRMLEENIAQAKNMAVQLENFILRNKECIRLNQERITELEANQKYLDQQIEQGDNRIKAKQEKLTGLKEEYSALGCSIEEKTGLLKEKEALLEKTNLNIKVSLEKISQAKTDILNLAARLAGLRNEVAEALSQEQIQLAHKKRLDIEKAKIREERVAEEMDLQTLTEEVNSCRRAAEEIDLNIRHTKNESQLLDQDLRSIRSQMQDLEKELLAAQSHKKFLEELQTRYADKAEAMNALIFLDSPAAQSMNGLLIRVHSQLQLAPEDKNISPSAQMKLSGKASSIDLDSAKASDKIETLQRQILLLQDSEKVKKTKIEKLGGLLFKLQEELRNQEINLANKKANQETAAEQLNRLKEEEDVLSLELAEAEQELSAQSKKITQLKINLGQWEDQEKSLQEAVSQEQNSISYANNQKQELLVLIAQTKTEVDSLRKRINLQEANLKATQDALVEDRQELDTLGCRWQEYEGKKNSLQLENQHLQELILQDQQKIVTQRQLLGEAQEKYKGICATISQTQQKLDADRKEQDTLQDKIHALQMQAKEIDFKILSLKEKTLQAYKVDLDTLDESALTPFSVDETTLATEILKLKDRLDSYGTVNLVAIEEYDELKKRYDFLTQQQNDLLCAQDSLKEAIGKINRTTRKTFLETFEKIRLEFRNYFRMLFNGGDAQLFLVDEQDVLESGIEIICRPAGKKLQNVLLLSGGERSLAAIALIFAIFRVKPAPFCVLDEIDAALDEANIDRFSRLFQEFSKDSQFIVITHNKRTIANADVMYGITMEESGISKIVSVKFAKEKQTQQETETAFSGIDAAA